VADITLNKYSSSLPDIVVMGIWAPPAILFLIWIWQVEAKFRSFQEKFRQHPISYILLILILIPIVWQATTMMLSKLRNQKPPVQPSATVQVRPFQSLQPVPSHQAPTIDSTTPQSAPSKFEPPQKLKLMRKVDKPRLPSAQPSVTPTRAQSAALAPIQSAERGIINNGVNFGQQLVDNRTFGVADAPPVILDQSTETLPVGKKVSDEYVGLETHPGITVSFQMDRTFNNPVFVIKCDRPCRAVQGELSSGMWQAETAIAMDKSATRIILHGAPIMTGTTVTIYLRSLDDNPVTVTSLIPYIEPIKK
jgi:hypothetical protein